MDKQSNSSFWLPIALATRTTIVLTQHVTRPKYNLVGWLDRTLVSSTLYVQQRAGFVIILEQMHLWYK